MKHFLWIILLITALTVPACAVELPDELENAVPKSAEYILELQDLSGADGLTDGILQILDSIRSHTEAFFAHQAKGAVQILLVVLLCGLVNTGAAKDGKTELLLPMAGSLAITALTVGHLNSLMGLGWETIQQLSKFSHVLLPVLTAATAAAGGVSSATVHQLTTVFFTELLIRLMELLLIPLVSIYVGLVAAAACLRSESLRLLSDGIRKVGTWILCTAMLLFTGYLSTVRVLSAAVDKTAVKVTKAAISSVVPVVGKIISEATESVLAGSLMLRNSIGAVGMLVILAACALPFLRLGIQYLLYKLTAFLASVTGTPELCRLISGLGSAFGLMLGMVGSCALLLLISVLSCVSAVVS